MYVTGRWVSTNVVGTMFVAWLVGVVIFVAVIVWQRRKSWWSERLTDIASAAGQS
ncbi:MAG: hypothetical protein ACN6RL_08560 [Variovorax sp.]|jgi:hypothetical protein|nr:hypothetical protein PMI12_00376 [Variovorax sp. CF313]